MVFPTTPLKVTCELNLAGTWTDITGYCLQEGSPLTAYAITRGRADEITTVTPAQCTAKLNNTDGRFSPRNPTGPYYGSLVRNTPLRVSVPDTGTYLRLEDDQVSWAQTLSNASLNPAGDMELQIDLQPSSYVPCVLASKDNGSAQRSWNLQMNGDGTISFNWSHNGSGMLGAQSTAPLPLGRISLRVTYASATGTTTFYTSTTPINSSPSWTQLGNASALGSSSTIFASTTTLEVGYSAGVASVAVPFGLAAPGITGKIFGFRLYSGIAGTLEASPDFTTATAGGSSLTDAQGNSWTLAGTATFSNRSFRFYGECSSLPQTWDVTGHDVWTPVTAAGPLRRLQQASKPVLSPMRRFILNYPTEKSSLLQASSSDLNQSTIAYWPCEDGAGATSIASGIAVNSDGNTPPPMRISGSPVFQGTAGSLAPDSVFACSAQLPQVGTSTWIATVPAYNGVATADSLFWLMSIPSGGLPNGAILLEVDYTPGFSIQVQYLTSSGGSIELNVIISGTLGATFATTGLNGLAFWCGLTNISTGTPTPTFTTVQTGPAATTVTSTGATTAGGNIASFIVNPGGANLGTCEMGQFWVSGAGSASGTAAGVPSLSSINAVTNVLNAYTGETAAARVGRLCPENGVQARIVGYPAFSAVMGPQQIDTLANLLQECEDADRGVLYEPRQCLGIGYRTLASMCAQPAASGSPAFILDFNSPADEISPPLTPVDDDQFIRNDVTVSRSGGSSYEYQVTTGALSVNAPPAGAGPYSTSLTAYCQFDAQLPDIASWIANVGTADRERFPQLSIDLASTDAAMQTLLPSIRDADIGAWIALNNPPGAWLPPDQIRLLYWGITEHLGDFAWQMTLNGVPEAPYEVAVFDDAVYGRCDTDGSTLHASITSAATSMQVDTTNANSPLWTTAAADFPFSILVAGEQMTVTNVTGSSSPQTFTVTRSVNGVVKAQGTGAAVSLFYAPLAAMT